MGKLRESTTLKIVLFSLGVLNYQWVFGEVSGTLTDYGTATSMILAVWLGREWKEKHYKPKIEDK